jgi:acetylornithine deacetylase/succinyl-diaminopimelate desuccinylase-like protein
MHKPDECVAIKDLESLTEIYAAVLEQFFKKKT